MSSGAKRGGGLLLALLATATRLALLAAVALLTVGCGRGGSGGGSQDPPSDDKPELTVVAAASLTLAFGRYAGDFAPARVRLSFGGSDELAAQVRRGAGPDVYAAANTKLPERLYREKLIERPVVFATNTLVLAVPRGSEIDSLDDLGRAGTRLVVGAASVPVGEYTREVLARLRAEHAERILRNVRSQEPDARGVVAKLAQGAADGGFVYRTDVVAAGGRLRAIELPQRFEPEAAYGAGVVRGSAHRELAREFVNGLVDGAGARALREAGFGTPPPR